MVLDSGVDLGLRQGDERKGPWSDAASKSFDVHGTLCHREESARGRESGALSQDV